VRLINVGLLLILALKLAILACGMPNKVSWQDMVCYLADNGQVKSVMAKPSRTKFTCLKMLCAVEQSSSKPFIKVGTLRRVACNCEAVFGRKAMDGDGA
jgi:hypothetical protein